ncbi:LysR family transcriptional regulator [Rhodobium gokarnense]|uniref:LysR family nitrogen assimilation transcriptional regulator n=1 Tax=Rhodobium gokarnense TaxID=364296 RepID=A0ABT3H664_9HYPH|nr:LysR family transcriptional regulator [Rhodobium gokarnense]MCW2305869.1 LysR family nitrogen assimilation transcriptional regulator [Rhodobium gokarnense]
MNEKQLHFFSAIAEFGSFSAAAAVLGLDQPSLSRYIRQLEDDIGAKLFHRTGRGVRLTETGEEFLGIAQRYLKDTDALRHKVDDGRNDLRGSISLGVIQFLGEAFVPDCLLKYNEMRPNMTVQVTGGGSGIIQEMLLSGRIDVGLLYDAGLSGDLVAEQVFTDRLVLYGSRELAGRHGFDGESELSLPRLAGVPIIAQTRQHGLRRAIEHAARRAGVGLNVVFEVDSLVTAKALARRQGGFAVVPFGSVCGDIDRPDVFMPWIGEPRIEVTFSIATARNRKIERGALELVSLIRSDIRDFAKSIEAMSEHR